MRKICKNCGEKIPKNSNTCKKCGEKYEYIDFEIDSETMELVTVRKKSNMIYICILILSILIFIYSLVLIYFKFTNKEETKQLPVASESSLNSSPDSVEQELNYFAVDFIGQPFKEIKAVLGDQYSIKLSAGSGETLVNYINVPVVLSSTDNSITDDSIISSVTVTNKGAVTSQITGGMTYTQLKSLLDLLKPAPVSDGTDEFFYAEHQVANQNYTIKARFRFESEDTETPCLAVILTCDALTAPKNYGTVQGLDEGSSLNVRQQALYDAQSIHQLHEGDVVEILDKVTTEDGALWYEISINNIKGYSIAEFIIPQQSETTETFTSAN